MEIRFLSQSDATNSWLALNDQGVSWFGSNSWDVQPNRESVRLESKTSYNNVLVIAQFDWVPGSYRSSHFLVPT